MDRRLADYKTEEGRSIPKYELLKRLLLDYITELPPEQEFLPFEETIAEKFGVCRSTVTKAMAKLRRDGYIETARKRGSRILKRTVDARRPVLNCQGMNGCIGFLLTNDRESDERAEEKRWRFVDETEHFFSRHGVRLVVYNLRENHWRTWSDPEVLLSSLRANGIQWVILRPSENLHYPWHEMLRFISQNGIKIVLTLQDITDLTLFADYCLPGMDYALVNCHAPILHTLESFDGIDGIFFLVNESCWQFAESRAKICETFARRKGIPFLCVKSARYEKNDENRDLWEPYADDASMESFMDFAGKCQKMICFGANDEHVSALFCRLRKSGKEFPNVTFIGHDNTQLSKQFGFSTFDFSYAERAEALYQLYTEFLGNPDRKENRGITTYSRFIKRKE